MKQRTSIGAFLIACSAICLIIAIERYYSALATAKQVAEMLEGVEFESVGIPIESIVCGLAGGVMLVAGVILIAERNHEPDQTSGLISESNRS